VGDRDNHNHCTHKFIDLANELKGEGFDAKLISAALMSASGIYATYSVAGNDGALNPSGVDKVVDTYRRNLEHIQKLKKDEALGKQEAMKAAGAEPEDRH
jgi:hypothetical protein